MTADLITIRSLWQSLNVNAYYAFAELNEFSFHFLRHSVSSEAEPEIKIELISRRKVFVSASKIYYRFFLRTRSQLVLVKHGEALPLF